MYAYIYIYIYIHLYIGEEIAKKIPSEMIYLNTKVSNIKINKDAKSLFATYVHVCIYILISTYTYKFTDMYT
jgi:hypothetical protein